MTTLADVNVTYAGLSCDIGKVEEASSDDEIRRIATESLLATHPDIAQDALQHYVVDRFNTPEGGRRIYVRPKVPFGAGAIERSEEALAEVKSDVLEALGAVTELQGDLIDCLADPRNLEGRDLEGKRLRLERALDALKGGQSVLKLFSAVKGGQA